MAHSAACSSFASQSSPTRRPNAETPHQLLSLPVSEKTTDAVLYHLHITCCRPPPFFPMHESSFMCSGLTTFEIPVSQRIRSPRKSDPGRIRYASGFDPTSADSIRGINGPVRFLLSICHSELCYISQYSCSSDLAKPRLRVYIYCIFVRVFLDSGSEYGYNLTRNNEYPGQIKLQFGLKQIPSSNFTV